MIRRVNLALMETVLAERRREHTQHPLAEYVRDWTQAHTLQFSNATEMERSFTISLNGQDD